MVAERIRAGLPPGLVNALRALRSRIRGRWVAVERLRPRRAYRGRDVVVVGMFRSGVGLGRAAELVARTLEAQGATVARVDVTRELGLAVVRADTGSILSVADAARLSPSDVVLVLNPNYNRALALLRRWWLLRCCVVAHWIFELEQLPPEWPDLAASFDEIWAPTELVAEAIRSSLDRFRGPIRVVPYAIDRAAFHPRDGAQRDAARRKFGIDRDLKVLGYAFSASSNYDRKNPEAAVDVFRAVFADGDRRGVLILRCRDFEHFPEQRQRLMARINGDERIRLIERDGGLTIDEFYSLIDVLVSPSRAEGYGLTLVEAAQAGVPAVTASWRLPPEVLGMPLVRGVGFDLVPVRDTQRIYSDIPGARWAEPRVDEMASAVRAICFGEAVAPVARGR